MTTHAHRKGEFGPSQRGPKKVVEKDLAYHLHHAKFHEGKAREAHAAHTSATSAADKAKFALMASHAAKKAEKHAKEARKLSPNSYEATHARDHAEEARSRAELTRTKSPAEATQRKAASEQKHQENQDRMAAITHGVVSTKKTSDPSSKALESSGRAHDATSSAMTAGDHRRAAELHGEALLANRAVGSTARMKEHHEMLIKHADSATKYANESSISARTSADHIASSEHHHEASAAHNVAGNADMAGQHRRASLAQKSLANAASTTQTRSNPAPVSATMQKQLAKDTARSSRERANELTKSANSADSHQRAANAHYEASSLHEKAGDVAGASRHYFAAISHEKAVKDNSYKTYPVRGI